MVGFQGFESCIKITKYAKFKSYYNSLSSYIRFRVILELFDSVKCAILKSDPQKTAD